MYFEDAQLSRLLSHAQVVVFDLNGLIVDDEPIQLVATNSALEGLGVSISKEDWIKRCVGHKPKEYLPSFLGDAGSDQAVIDCVLANKQIAYEALVSENAQELIREGFISLIQYLLRENRRRIAVATSTTRSGAELILSHPELNLLKCIDLLITGDEVAQAKPDPEIYLFVRSHFASQRAFLVFEDSLPGVRSARAAGMVCVAVPNDFTAHQNFAEADAVISNLSRNARKLSNRKG
jgi:HAD superfamily hydrolase (TIGR01509 family)